MGDFDSIAVIDWETYYASDYTLSKMTTESYVRDPRFETIGVGVKMNGERVWFEHEEFVAWAAQVDWSRVAVVHHHAHFDGLIESFHYDIHPAFFIDTLSMARIFVPTDVGGSLAKLSRYFGVGEKGDEVVKAFGKRRRDFTRDEWLKYGDYCMLDCDLTEAIAEKMIDGVPEDEMLLIDLTVKAFTEPVFVGDQTLLAQFIVDEQKRKQDLLDRIAKDKSILMSNDKFAQLLIELGEDPPMKVSPKMTKTAMKKAAAAGLDPNLVEPVETYAFAKTDVGMQALLEHEREEIRWVAEARVGVKSTINETRATRLLGSAQRGPMPVYLRYAGAHTYRFSGGDKQNWQNFQRGGTLRDAILAPGDS